LLIFEQDYSSILLKSKNKYGKIVNYKMKGTNKDLFETIGEIIPDEGFRVLK